MKKYVINGKTIQGFRFDGTISQLRQELPREVFNYILLDGWTDVMREARKVVYNDDHTIKELWPYTIYEATPIVKWPHTRIKKRHCRSYRQWDQFYNYDKNHRTTRKYQDETLTYTNPIKKKHLTRFEKVYKYYEHIESLAKGDIVSVKYVAEKDKEPYSPHFGQWQMKPSLRIYKQK